MDYRKLSASQRRRVREEYVERQVGLCHHCNSRLDQTPRPDIAKLPVKASLFSVGFFTYPVHLHHNHKTGMTLGAVHCHCNAVLWQYHKE
jgi:hypothetical protein